MTGRLGHLFFWKNVTKGMGEYKFFIREFYLILYNVFLRFDLRVISASVLETLPNFEKIPVLGFSVLEDFEKFQKSPCVGDFFVCLPCVGGLWKFSKIPYRDFPPVCGFFGLWCVETLKFFTKPLCVGPVVCGNFENFSKFPCVWEAQVEISLKTFKNVVIVQNWKNISFGISLFVTQNYIYKLVNIDWMEYSKYRLRYKKGSKNKFFPFFENKMFQFSNAFSIVLNSEDPIWWMRK